MKGFQESLRYHASGKKVVVLFILTQIVYAVMLGVTIPKTMAFSGGMRLLDMMPMGYTPRYVILLFVTLGDQGRKVYLFNQIPIDMIYPLLFACCYSLLFVYFLKKINKERSIWFHICWLPVLAAGADYLENFGIIAMLSTYPDVSSSLMQASNIFTRIKSMATMLYFIALLIVILALAFHVWRGRKADAVR